jgi:kanamycin kinase
VKRTLLSALPEDLPREYLRLLEGAPLYDSSCSTEARVIYIDRDGGYFLKAAPKGSLACEAEMAAYFHGKGLTASVLSYLSASRDWLLTERVRGEDATYACYLSEPARLAETTATLLRELHETDFSDCPVQDRMESYFSTVETHYASGEVDLSYAPFASSVEEAYRIAREGRTILTSDTLLHGDYCLPNLILDGWTFSGYIDLGRGGVGDRHVDLFWGAWTLAFNLGTDRYRERFFDAYGRDRINEDALRVIAAAEVFG